jgi:5-formyltetrahydrofolate cyclo-ligase
MGLSVSKKSLREEYLLKRRLMPTEDAARLSLVVCDYLLSLPEFVSSSRIALYAGVHGEVSTDRIFKAAITQGKEVFFPKSESTVRPLLFYKTDSLEDLTPGLYGVPEPEGRGESVSPIDPAELDLIVVPGIVFDHSGARLGFGKGYYDMVLSGVSAVKVALAFYMQVLEEPLPTEAHDIRMDMLITERGIESF